ncbi:hypothetical protein [Pedobacter metabolipauper]|uniref:Uncharacterized protein n=1 Tax=Pedobacter metabolipauper TaxID=425513 RepID=A0A4R6SY07_9SPHI|nr:hypothetical protein [Pedobacter metabolipauper]TDQ11424.1 hypothetical protein ATK78_0546 [Pedobacter metabolipauper]
MIFTEELLIDLEKETELKKRYAVAGSLGQNKLVAIPLVIIALCAFGAYYFYSMSGVDASSRTYLMVCIAIIVISLIVMIRMFKSSIGESLARLDDVPVCLAKQVYGNDQSETYYCIYTTGALRHNADFIEAVADKISNLEEEPDAEIRKIIDRLFEPSFTGDKILAELLPLEFTFNEEVYRKEIRFMHLSSAMKQAIAENNGKCIVFVFGRGGAPVLNELPA